jgi:hypothetical protein
VGCSAGRLFGEYRYAARRREELLRPLDFRLELARALDFFRAPPLFFLRW